MGLCFDDVVLDDSFLLLLQPNITPALPAAEHAPATWRPESHCDTAVPHAGVLSSLDAAEMADFLDFSSGFDLILDPEEIVF